MGRGCCEHGVERWKSRAVPAGATPPHLMVRDAFCVCIQLARRALDCSAWWNRVYQMTMRCSGGKYIGSLGSMPNASKNSAILREGCTARTIAGA